MWSQCLGSWCDMVSIESMRRHELNISYLITHGKEWRALEPVIVSLTWQTLIASVLCTVIASWHRHTFWITDVLCGNPLVDSPHRGRWCGVTMFSLLAWTSCGRNSRVAGDMRHHDLTVMILFTLLCYVLVNFRETSLALGQFYHRQRALSYTLYDEMLLMHIFSGGEDGGWGGVGWSGYISLRPFVVPPSRMPCPPYGSLPIS